MPKDIYLQPDAPDDVLDDELILSLTRRHVPDAQTVTLIDESGGEARTYFVDEHIVVKTQRPNRLRPRTSLSKEVFFLEQIAERAPELSVPRVLGYGREEPFVEYTVMTRMSGVALRHVRLSAEQRNAVMRELGWTLRRIHQLPLAPFVASGMLPADQTSADVRRRFAEWFDEIVVRIHDQQRAWSLSLTPEQASARALALLPAELDRVALHSNPYHEHTFVDPDTGTYSGLIDFGDAYISHPTFDLRRWRTRAEREALRAGYTATQPVTDAFARTWLVAQVLGDMAAIAGTLALAEQASADLKHLLAEF